MSLQVAEQVEPAEPMAPETAAAVTAFARACKSAARTVALYPAEHPNVGVVLDTLTTAAQAMTAHSEVSLGVEPEAITVAGHPMARPDAAVVEFAALLHSHHVGVLTVHPLTDADLWRRFLALLALPPDQGRQRGGLGKLWATEGQPRIEVRSLDYRELLRSNLKGDRAVWERILESCLEGQSILVDDDFVDLLFGVLDDPARIDDLVSLINVEVGGGGAGGTGGGSGASKGPMIMAGLLHAVARYVEQTHPAHLDRALSALAEAAARMPASTIDAIVRAGRGGSRPELQRFVRELIHRIRDESIAGMIAAEVRGGRGTSRQLADAFCGLAPEVERRATILTLARKALTPSDAPAALPADSRLARAWDESEQMLLTYSDQAFVSDAYNVEMQRLADRAVELDQDQTDPADRQAAWCETVSDTEVRMLDAELLVDLLRLEGDPARWRALADLAASRVNVLLVMGDFNAAAFLLEALRAQADEHADAAVREAAAAVMTSVLTPSMMRHVATHLDTADRAVVDGAGRFCRALGTVVVGPLAEVLSREERARPRQHLIAILIGFGASGRQAVDELRLSPNAAVRRTAVLLLREFGGRDALGELESLLDDSEPHVQREATLAIAMMGIEPAFETLAKALAHGSAESAGTIMGVIWTLGDDEAGPLLAYLVEHAPYRGALWSIHARAIGRLGTIGGRVAIAALEAALERRQVWAPFRTAATHRLALAALAEIGTADAWRVVEAAAANGPRRQRAAARARLASRKTTQERQQA